MSRISSMQSGVALARGLQLLKDSQWWAKRRTRWGGGVTAVVGGPAGGLQRSYTEEEIFTDEEVARHFRNELLRLAELIADRGAGEPGNTARPAANEPGSNEPGSNEPGSNEPGSNGPAGDGQGS